MRVVNVKIRPMNNMGNLMAFAEITVGDNNGSGIMIMKGWKVMKNQKDGSIWAAAPASKGKNSDGEEQWYPDIYFLKESEDAETFKNHLQESVVTAYESTVKDNEGYIPTQKKKLLSDMYNDDLGISFP